MNRNYPNRREGYQGGGHRRGGGGGGRRPQKFKRKPYFPKKNDIITKEMKEHILELDKEVRDIIHDINISDKNIASKENNFRVKTISKIIVLTTITGKEVEGELVDIDKYRIIVQVGDKKKYYYKHALVNYYAKEE